MGQRAWPTGPRCVWWRLTPVTWPPWWWGVSRRRLVRHKVRGPRSLGPQNVGFGAYPRQAMEVGLTLKSNIASRNEAHGIRLLLARATEANLAFLLGGC